MLAKSLLIVILCSHYVVAQPYYTRIRGAFGVELNGITPRGAVTAEAAFGYLRKSFWNIQAGVGMINKRDFRSPAFSGALTHCVIINAYKRKACIPHPGNYLVESYFEAGLGGFMVDRYDAVVSSGITRQRLLTPSALAGFRFNILTRKLIYILKLRYTPALLPNILASNIGIGVGVGWR